MKMQWIIIKGFAGNQWTGLGRDKQAAACGHMLPLITCRNRIAVDGGGAAGVPILFFSFRTGKWELNRETFFVFVVFLLEFSALLD